MNQSRYAILGMLTIEPMSGYDIKRITDKSLAFFWHESYGNLYPRLAELEAEGLVTSRARSRGRGPKAKVYSITARGRKALIQWLAKPARQDAVRSEVLLKVFYGANVSVGQTLRLVEDQRREEQKRLAEYKEIEREVRANASEHPALPFWLLSLRRGQLVTEARLRWCTESRSALRKLAVRADRAAS